MPRPGTESEVNGRSIQTRKSDRFLAGLEAYKSVTFVSHVHPDPDSLGSMVGLAHLVESTLGLPCRITRDGPICRAENRAMVEALDMPLTPIEKIVWSPTDAVVMVDSQPKTGRHSFNGEVTVYGVLDHHQTPGELQGIPFLDIRRGIGATCSLVTRYLMEQDTPVPEHIATSLYYGIETEVGGFPREASALDDDSLQFLFPLVDLDLIAKIKNTPLPEHFYETLLVALQSSFIYDKLLISWINDLPQPELCAQVVDFMVRHEGIEWALVAGVYQNEMILSMRTNAPRAQAGELLRQVVGKVGGKAGGHDRRAGGTIPMASTSASAIEALQSELRRRLLKALSMEDLRGQRLLSRKEMLQCMA